MDVRPGNDDKVVGSYPSATTLEESRSASEIRPAGLRTIQGASERADRTRWGPIIAGAFVAVALYLLLELVLVAADVLDVGANVSGSLPGGWPWAIAAAAVAFLLGGIVAGASTRWRSATDGVLHGVVTWAVASVVIVLLASIGRQLNLYSIGTAFDRLDEATAGAPTSALK